MKNLKLIALCGLFFCGSEAAMAQQAPKCATQQIRAEVLKQRPDLIPAYLHNYNHNAAMDRAALTKSHITGKPQMKTTGTPLIIPVVFHVLLTQAKVNQLGGASGAMSRMLTQIDVLNKDFGGRNSDSTNIPAAFKPFFAHSDIQFSPAHRTPTNGYTEGMNLVITTVSNFSADLHSGSDPKNPIAGGVAAWDPTRYLNIWVVDIAESGILGYSIPPSFVTLYGFDPNHTGVVLDYGAFGKRTSVTQFFSPSVNDEGRTLTHEVGHFFELEHTFGEGPDCPANGDIDDGISDTPPQAQPTYNSGNNCPSFPLTDVCTPSGNGIMWMNYMDYVNDNCMFMFTKGQELRMENQLIPGAPSYSLTQHPEVLQWPTSVSGIPEESAVTILPNPSSGQFEVWVPSSQGLKAISVLNMMGQLVYSVPVTNQTITNYHVDISSLSKGVYMVQCTFEGGTISKKILLQ
ncbi:MAG: T9SS type A sorting domain-containing protein [Sphingobacteriales bacterium]|nr:MAG: T9SS type A sorting domain-containing protein [Sphingobacteriales bacterium]